MTEENQNNQVVEDQTPVGGSTATEEVVDWEKRYHEEAKQSKSYRNRAQDAEGKLSTFENERQVARKKRLAEDGKLQQIIDEQDKTSAALTKKAAQGDQFIEQQKEMYLNQLPEEDRQDFEDLPLDKIQKIVEKLNANKAVKPEIPTVAAASKVTSAKPWSQMTEDERKAFYAQKQTEAALNN